MRGHLLRKEDLKGNSGEDSVGLFRLRRGEDEPPLFAVVRRLGVAPDESGRYEGRVNGPGVLARHRNADELHHARERNAARAAGGLADVADRRLPVFPDRPENRVGALIPGRRFRRRLGHPAQHAVGHQRVVGSVHHEQRIPPRAELVVQPDQPVNHGNPPWIQFCSSKKTAYNVTHNMPYCQAQSPDRAVQRLTVFFYAK